jgi:hypothetical protein
MADCTVLACKGTPIVMSMCSWVATCGLWLSRTRQQIRQSSYEEGMKEGRPSPANHARLGGELGTHGVNARRANERVEK